MNSRSFVQRAAACAVAVLLVTACSSGPSVFVNTDPSTDVGQFHTYGFMDPLDTDRPNYSSLLSTYLRTATARELDARGWTVSASPDVLVNFHVETKERIRSNSVPSGPAFGGYYGYRRGYYDVWGGYETQVTQYTEGTLTIDMVDTDRRQLVWEGTIVGRVRDEDRKNLQPVIDQAVAAVFEKFPARAP